MNKRQIAQWLDKKRVVNYTINADLSVDVDGNVDISSKNLTSIPIQFGKVTGNFYCHNNKLTSLEYCPTHIGVDFYCDNNQLTSLEHCPTHVGGNFSCDKINMSEEVQLWLIAKQVEGMRKINNPIEKAIALHKMLWEI